MRVAPLRVGVIGLGRAFTLMLPTFAGDPRWRLVAGCDPREAARARVASDFGAPAHASAAGVLIAAYDGQKGGTMSTMLYAMRQGLEIIEIMV